MKRYVKILLLISAALALIGAICFAVLAARGGLKDLQNITNEEYTKVENSYTVATDGTISIDLTITELVILLSDDADLTLSYYESDRFKYAVEASDSELSISFIEPKDISKWFFTFDLGYRPMTLSIPKDFAGRIEIKTATGNLSVKNISDIKELDISATTGNIELDTVSADGVRVDVKTGNIKAKKLDASEFIDLSSTTGDIELKNASAPRITTKSTTGSQTLAELSSDVASHTASTGSIVFDKLDAKDITLTASTGSVRGTLMGKRGDYIVTVSTSTGDSNIKSDLPEHLSSAIRPEPLRTLCVKTSTGNIHIKFEGTY